MGWDSFSDMFDGGGMGGSSDRGYSTGDHSDYNNDYESAFGHSDPTAQDHGNDNGNEGNEGNESSGTSRFNGDYSGSGSEGTSTTTPTPTPTPSSFQVAGVQINLGSLANSVIGQGIAQSLSSGTIQSQINDLDANITRINVIEVSSGTWSSTVNGNTVEIRVNPNSRVNESVDSISGLSPATIFSHEIDHQTRTTNVISENLTNQYIANNQSDFQQTVEYYQSIGARNPEAMARHEINYGIEEPIVQENANALRAELGERQRVVSTTEDAREVMRDSITQRVSENNEESVLHGHSHFVPHLYGFDALEYIASHDDLISAFGANSDAGATHFINHGHGEGRTTTFDGLEYIASYGDLMNAFGANSDAGATHFINHGHGEGRTTTFDGLEYIASYDDLIFAFGSDSDAGATHFIVYGNNEGRETTFDVAQYLANYADLNAAFGNDHDPATIHYIDHGFFEDRTDDFLFV